MNILLALWLPILLAAVAVFIISSLVHMVFKWHASDYNTVSNEDAVRAAINASNAGPGRYVIPHCKDMKDMASPEMMKKYQEGPVMHFTILPKGVPNMGRYLGQWFLWSLVIAAVAAWLFAFGYYSVLGGAWMRAQGKTPEQCKAEMAGQSKLEMAAPFVLAFAGAVIMAWALYGVLLHMGNFTARAGAISGAIIWFGFVLTTITVNNAFAQRPRMLTVIDSLQWLGGLAIMGAIVGWFGA